MSFLNNNYARVLTLVLLLQAVAYYAIARRPETAPPMMPLSFFPASFEGWNLVKDTPVEKEVIEVLRTDDTLNRIYSNPAGTDSAGLFIAFFKTQRYGQSPHSPKNCLPASGWDKISDERVPIRVRGWDTPIMINQFVVQHGEEKSVTLYWYQSHRRVVADEISAKLWLVADAIRYHRSDTALVRVTAEVHNNNIQAAVGNGIQFVQVVFPQILKQLPL